MRCFLPAYLLFYQKKGQKIWERGELSSEPYIPCYVTRTERSGVRAQRGLSFYI